MTSLGWQNSERTGATVKGNADIAFGQLDPPSDVTDADIPLTWTTRVVIREFARLKAATLI